MERTVSTPLVSVIMPCYNHARYLPDSIESVLGQCYGNLELIITDDRSKDGSMEVIDQYRRLDKRIGVVRHERNMGEGKSRNDALALCKGEYVAFCDADDVWERNKLTIQLEVVRTARGSDVIHSDSRIIDEDGNATGMRYSSRYQKGRQLSGDLFHHLCLTNFINVPTMLIPKQRIMEAGVFEEDFRYLTDWIYWVKIARNGEFFYIDEPLARYRVHDGSTNNDICGYSECRIKGYNYILESFPDLPTKVRARILYELGINHDALGSRGEARECFIRSFRADPLNVKSVMRIVHSAER
jgi:glycosyltransferase involved in cell wall biosynthesis